MKVKRIILLLVLFLIITPIRAEEIADNQENDTQSIVKIKNINKEDEYVSGSVLQIQNENGFILQEFTSSREDFVLENLEEGKYYLVQLSAPNEYDLNPNKVEFSVKEGTTEVQIINERSIILPGDMSANSILLISMAMLDITIIIGVIVYVKKNKIKQ